MLRVISFAESRTPCSWIFVRVKVKPETTFNAAMFSDSTQQTLLYLIGSDLNKIILGNGSENSPSFWTFYLGRAKRIWYLSHMRAAKVQASLRIRAVSPEPSLLAHTSSESRGTFRRKARSLAPLNGWACAVKVCHDGMLEDTNSLDSAHFITCRTVAMNLSGLLDFAIIFRRPSPLTK